MCHARRKMQTGRRDFGIRKDEREKTFEDYVYSRGVQWPAPPRDEKK